MELPEGCGTARTSWMMRRAASMASREPLRFTVRSVSPGAMSTSLATYTKQPVCAEMRWMLSPPRPITSPTTVLGIFISSASASSPPPSPPRGP